ncbi:hypothetical protein ALC60_13554, partial [Trachymyrmex zeteki]
GTCRIVGSARSCFRTPLVLPYCVGWLSVGSRVGYGSGGGGGGGGSNDNGGGGGVAVVFLMLVVVVVESLNYSRNSNFKAKKSSASNSFFNEVKLLCYRGGGSYVVEPVLARKSGVSQYATRQHSFENERISKRALDRRRRDDPECTSELSANQKAFYTGTEPPPPLSSLMAGKEQPGRLLVRTFVSYRRGHAEMWPSTCSQGFEARAHARSPGPTIEKEANKMFP